MISVEVTGEGYETHSFVGIVEVDSRNQEFENHEKIFCALVVKVS